MKTGTKAAVIGVLAFCPPGLFMVAAPITVGLLGGVDPASLVAAVGCAITTTDPGVDTTGLKVGDLTPEQMHNAGVIYDVALQVFKGTGHEARAAIVGLATAMQESTLKNIHYGDRDSLGLFQQRSAWGTPQERTDPPQAATMFYTGGHGGQNGLEDIQAWWAMPVTEAAQRVQVSAFPLAYAQWEPLATQLEAKLAGLPDGSTPSGDPCGGAGNGGTPVTLPPGAVGQMLQAAVNVEGTPYVWGGTTIPPGVDCSGLVIYAWGKAGYSLTVRTAAQMYGVSDPVKAGSEVQGDLLFSEFDSSGPGHVMIVLDPARQIAVEAPHTGDVVKEIRYDTSTQTLGRLKRSAFRAGPP